MADRILLKRSSTASAAPTAAQLDVGELALNVADGRLYFKTSAGVVLTVDPRDTRLTDAREWTAATVSQAEAEAGTASTRRAWTSQRVRQAIAAWWAALTVDASKITTGTFAAARIPTLNQNTTGNAATATKLATARTINGASFDGSANITIGVDWSSVTNKPSTYAPSAHSHTQSDITGLTVALAGKEPAITGTGQPLNYLNGNKEWSSLPSAVMICVISVPAKADLPIQSGDFMDDALGKIQAQIDNRVTKGVVFNEPPITTVAGAATTNLATTTSNTVTVTGSGASISSLGTVASGARRTAIFAGAHTLVHSANIVLPTSTNIVTAAGDTAEFVSLGGGSWRCVDYTRMSGLPLVSPAPVNPRQLCTAWVNFNGTGTVAIRDSYNVSSVTDNGVGDYTVNFAVAMDSANYAALSGGADDNGGQTATTGYTWALTNASFRVRTRASSGVDREIVSAVTFGGKN